MPRLGVRGAGLAVVLVAGCAFLIVSWSTSYESRASKATSKPQILVEVQEEGAQERASSDIDTGPGKSLRNCESVPCTSVPCDPVSCKKSDCAPVKCTPVPCDTDSCPERTCPKCDKCPEEECEICKECPVPKECEVCKECTECQECPAPKECEECPALKDCNPVPCEPRKEEEEEEPARKKEEGAILGQALPGTGKALADLKRLVVADLPLQEHESGEALQTRFVEEEAVRGVTFTLENVCMGGRAGGVNGGIMLIYGMGEADVDAAVRKAGFPRKYWDKSFNCRKKGGGCFNHTTKDKFPRKYRWVKGTTGFALGQHINVFHSMADAVWPFFVGQLDNTEHMAPSKETLDHIWLGFMQKMEEMEEEGDGVAHTALWQMRMAMLASPRADLLVMGPISAEEPVCFERLRVTVHMCCHLSPVIGAVGEQKHFAALRRYRSLVFRYLRVTEEPKLRSLGEKLRVTYYSRADSRRRRIANSLEVLDALYNFRWWEYKPSFELRMMDAIYLNPLGPPTFRDQVLMFANSDIALTAHGAGLWASLFLPSGAAMAEIHGPCISTKITWCSTFGKAVPFTHDTSNPTLRGTVGSGRTSGCGSGHESGDYNMDIKKLEVLVKKFLANWPSTLPGFKLP